jgi:hypothetical protein
MPPKTGNGKKNENRREENLADDKIEVDKAAAENRRQNSLPSLANQPNKDVKKKIQVRNVSDVSSAFGVRPRDTRAGRNSKKSGAGAAGRRDPRPGGPSGAKHMPRPSWPRRDIPRLESAGPLAG